MTTNQLINKANLLAKNNLSITRFTGLWNIHSYHSTQRGKDINVETRSVNKALNEFINLFNKEEK